MTNLDQNLKNLTSEQVYILQELERRKIEEKIRYWKPHPKQLLASRNNARRRLILGGNRSGKSEWSVIEAISYAIGKRLYLHPKDPDYIIDVQIPNKGRMAGEDFSNHIGTVLIPKLKEWIPKGYLQDIKKNARGQETLFRFKNGSTIELMSYEQESDKFEGWDGDFVCFDEPPPREIYIACLRGLVDRGGKMWFSMTPLKEPWIYNELWIKNDENKDTECFTFDIRDNVGFGLEEKDVLDFEKSLNEDEKNARLHGKFRHLQGLVYKEFNPHIHITDGFDVPKDFPIFESIDPHPRTPTAVIWMTVDPKGTKYIIDELFKSGTISEIAQYIKAKRKGRKPVVSLIDPFSTAPDPIGGTNIQSEFCKHGIYTVTASKELHAGINRVKHALKPQFGPPEIYIFKNCQETIHEFQTYIWDDYRGRAKDYKTPKQNPIDKDDHFMECLYRLLLFNPKYRNVNSWRHHQEYKPRNLRTGY